MSDMPSAAPDPNKLIVSDSRRCATSGRSACRAHNSPLTGPAHSHSADDGHSASGGCHNSADREPELLPAVSGDTSAAPL